jgi:glycine cleavage system T protein (aminomethyltransferase)
MTALSPFHPRTAALNAKLAWSEWATYLSPAGYADAHDIEYTAVREAAGVFDVSPLYKYVVSGPDAVRLVDRVITRDATRLEVGQVAYTPWCDEAGKVIDDGTVARLGETRFRWTAADPQYRWLGMNAAGLDVEIEDVTDSVAALALQGPRSRGVLEAVTGEEWGGLRYFRRRSCTIAGADVDVSRTGYTGDLGYELWIPAASAVDVWDALFAAGEQHGIRPAGLRALDVVRVEAGLVLIEVDYTSAFRATTPDHEYSPFEIGLGRLVNFEKPSFVGRRALLLERSRGGPRRRLVGLELDWAGIERAFARHDLPPAVSAAVSREPVPVYGRRSQVGRATSTCWSPLLKKMVALASVAARHSAVGTPLEVEWSVEGERGRVPATVVELPFLDLPRRREIV